MSEWHTHESGERWKEADVNDVLVRIIPSDLGYLVVADAYADLDEADAHELAERAFKLFNDFVKSKRRIADGGIVP